jgi:hypothetical protein
MVFISIGIFRLTDPPGLDVISNCKKTPAFHPHPDLPIYTVSYISLNAWAITHVLMRLYLLGC